MPKENLGSMAWGWWGGRVVAAEVRGEGGAVVCVKDDGRASVGQERIVVCQERSLSSALENGL